jgi:hypothetical protein
VPVKLLSLRLAAHPTDGKIGGAHALFLGRCWPGRASLWVWGGGRGARVEGEGTEGLLVAGAAVEPGDVGRGGCEEWECGLEAGSAACTRRMRTTER